MNEYKVHILDERNKMGKALSVYSMLSKTELIESYAAIGLKVVIK